MTATDEEKDKIKEMERAIRETLETQLPKMFTFDPIRVEPKVDHPGDDCLHAYIVLEGNPNELDPAWTMALPGKIWPLSERLGYPGIPINSSIPKSEWPALERAIR